MITDDMMSGKRLPQKQDSIKEEPENYEDTPDLD